MWASLSLGYDGSKGTHILPAFKVPRIAATSGASWLSKRAIGSWPSPRTDKIVRRHTVGKLVQFKVAESKISGLDGKPAGIQPDNFFVAVWYGLVDFFFAKFI